MQLYQTVVCKRPMLGVNPDEKMRSVRYSIAILLTRW